MLFIENEGIFLDRRKNIARIADPNHANDVIATLSGVPSLSGENTLIQDCILVPRRRHRTGHRRPYRLMRPSACPFRLVLKSQALMFNERFVESADTDHDAVTVHAAFSFIQSPFAGDATRLGAMPSWPSTRHGLG